MDNDTITHDSHAAITLNLTICNIATADCAYTANLKGLTDFRMTDYSLAEGRCEHTLHSSFDFFDSFVNYSVHTHIDLVKLSRISSACVRTYIETYNNRIRCRCKRDITFGDSTYCAVDNSYTYFLIGNLFKTLSDCLNATLNICFNDNVKILNITLLNLTEEVIKVDTLSCLVSFIFNFLLSHFNNMACSTLVFYYIEWVATIRSFAKTYNFDGSGGNSLLNLLALVIYHSSYPADCSTCYDNISLTESTILYKNCCDRSTTLVKLRLDNSTSCMAVGISLKLLHFSGKKYHFQK